MAQSKQYKITARYTVICSVSGKELITHTTLDAAIKDCSQFLAAYIRREIHIKVDKTLSVTSVTDINTSGPMILGLMSGDRNLPVHDQYPLTESWKRQIYADRKPHHFYGFWNK